MEVFFCFDPNCPNLRTTFFESSFSVDINLIIDLLLPNANPRIPGPMFEQVNRGQSQIDDVMKFQVQQLLNEGLKIDRCVKYMDGDWLRCYTPLCIAIAHGSIQLVRLFITSGQSRCQRWDE